KKAVPPGALLLVPEHLDLSGLERQLLDAWPAQQRADAPVDHAAPLPDVNNEALSDAELLRWVLLPADAPAPRRGGTVAVFRAIGEINEVREVIRRRLSGQIPLDQVELLCTDSNTYVPLIFETFARLSGDDDVALDALPVTFHDGIPAPKTRPGRAL